MAKKKSGPGPSKKSCGKKCSKKIVEQVEPEVVAKKETKTEYFLSMIKKAFGYE
jgi:hypothetical protein